MNSKLLTGDVFYRKDSKDLYGRAIRWFTKSRYSHVGIILAKMENGYYKVAEALDKGFVIHEMHENYLYKHHDIGRICKSLSTRKRDILRSNTIKLQGRAYDWRSIVLIVLNGIGLHIQSNTVNKVICSEAVCRVYDNSFGIDLVPSKSHDVSTPADISEYPQEWVHKCCSQS